MEDVTRATTSITFSSGTIKDPHNEYNLIFYANFVPNLFSNCIDVIGEAGFDKEFEKDEFRFRYYPDTYLVQWISNYRVTVVDIDVFDKYKNHVQFKNTNNTPSLPWIRYPRTKDGILIPQLVERIFGKIPAQIVFVDLWSSYRPRFWKKWFETGGRCAAVGALWAPPCLSLHVIFYF